MESTVKKEVKVILELTEEEFNTIFVTFGITSAIERREAGIRHGLETLQGGHEFYEQLAKIVKTINS